MSKFLHKAGNETTHLLVLDFCDTLVKGQTGDQFIKFILKKSPIRGIFYAVAVTFFIRNFYRLLSKLIPIKITDKEFLAWGLIGMTEAKLISFGRDFAVTVLDKSINIDVIQYVKYLIATGKYKQIVIISGGYHYYMSDVLKLLDIPFNQILTSRFKIRCAKSMVTGLIYNCMGENKVKSLKDVFGNFYTFDLVTDSLDDWPLMVFSNKTFFVSDGQINNSIIFNNLKSMN
jgi:phosphoserine phosphatase